MECSSKIVTLPSPLPTRPCIFERLHDFALHMKQLKNVISVLYELSAAADLGLVISYVRTVVLHPHYDNQID